MTDIENEMPLRFDAEQLGKNIRAYRSMRGMTQIELAEKLFVAPQSVSKWERGENIPDLTRFCRLAQELSVSLDVLVGGEPKEKTYIGIDGGGTKTEFALVNDRGELLNRIILGPSNPNTCGLDSTLSVVRQGIDFLRHQDMNVCGIFFGGAGLGTGNHAKVIRNRLIECYPGVKIGCGTDILNVTACSSDSENCIAVICGTGSVVFAANGDELLRTGGGGYLFDRSGSGYHLGHSALVAALEERDGTGPTTLLTQLVEEKLGGTVWDNITRLYKENVSFIASFAPLVTAACAQGDPVACEIMQENADRLVKLISVARKKAPEARVLVLAGSLFKKNEAFLRQVTKQLDNHWKIELPDYPPVWGACLRSLKLGGVAQLPDPELFVGEQVGQLAVYFSYETRNHTCFGATATGYYKDYRTTLETLFRAGNNAHTVFDFPKDAETYPLVLLPSALAMTREEQAAMKRYLATGGKVIATGPNAMPECRNSWKFPSSPGVAPTEFFHTIRDGVWIQAPKWENMEQPTCPDANQWSEPLPGLHYNPCRMAEEDVTSAVLDDCRAYAKPLPLQVEGTDGYLMTMFRNATGLTVHLLAEDYDTDIDHELDEMRFHRSRVNYITKVEPVGVSRVVRIQSDKPPVVYTPFNQEGAKVEQEQTGVFTIYLPECCSYALLSV